MAHNFEDTYAGNLVGLWDFRPCQETDDTGLDDGITQDGSLVGGARTYSGWLVTDGDNDRFDVPGNDGSDAPFDLSQGTIVVEFSQFSHAAGGPETIVSRGIADQGDTEEFFEIRVTADGAIQAYHVSAGEESLLSTQSGFLEACDTVKVTYSWSDTTGPRMLVENTTADTSTTLTGDTLGLTMDMDTGEGQSFVFAAQETADEDFGQHFDGAINYVAVLDEPVLMGAGDGIVEGTSGDDLIDLAYTGDPEGDMIDNGDAVLPGEAPNDDVVDAGAGDDLILAGQGDDEVFAGSGGDTVYGEAGNDVIWGDSNAPGGSADAIRESFEWDLAPDPNGSGGIDDGDDLSGGFTQNTGSVDVTYSVVHETPEVDTTFDTQNHKVNHINTGGGLADNNSGLKSVLNGQENSAEYKLAFSQSVENVSFRINDIDGDAIVQVQAFDADGVLIPVVLDEGPRLAVSDQDEIAGNDTIDSLGGYANPQSAAYSVLVTIPGPVAYFTIGHDQDGVHNTGIWVTDVYYDVTPVDTGPDGDDILDGGDGDDIIFGQGGDDIILGGQGSDILSGGNDSDVIVGGEGDDTIHGDGTTGEGNSAGGGGDILFGGGGDDKIVGGSGSDLIDGADGADDMIGGADQDWFIEVGIGDVIDGSETGIDNDTIVISGPAVVNYDPSDPEAGTIEFYDLDTQTITGTATFKNIENVLYVEDIVNPIAPSSGAPDSDDPAPAVPYSDGIVMGTDGPDHMDDTYTGDPDGDMIDDGIPSAPDGGPNDDIIMGLDENDTILAGLGDDEAFGGDGNDDIYGGVGNDVLRGEDGDDTLFGEAGNDQLSGGDGNDVMDGGSGHDILDGRDGDDTLDGNVGNDFLVGGDGNDVLSGGEGNDLILGGEGNDRIDLGADDNHDLSFGGDDADIFTGLGQGDVVDGGEGGLDQDTLDLNGAAQTANPGGSLSVAFNPGNPENGVVSFFDNAGVQTGTSRFYNIETVIPCFTPGTLIATPRGEMRVEDLRIGDRVITRDNGIQEIRWVGARDLTGPDLAGAVHLNPVLIRQGALGNGLPERDMKVSPNHRVLVANDKTSLYFEDREVLVAAKHLTGIDGIETVEVPGVTYIHFMFTRHEVVLSDGTWTESFQPGDLTLNGIGNAQRNEILELFPELKNRKGLEAYSSARRSLKKHEARLLM